MQHAVDAEVVHEDVTARDLARDVGTRQRLADDRVCCRILERRFRVDLERELPAADELAIANRRATGLRADLAIRGFELRGRAPELLRRKPDQRNACRRGGAADLHAADGGAPTARGRALVRTQRRVALDQRHAGEIDAELLGSHLRNRDAQPLSEIHEPGEDRHRAVGVDHDESVDFRGVERARAEDSAGRRLLRDRVRREA